MKRRKSASPGHSPKNSLVKPNTRERKDTQIHIQQSFTGSSVETSQSINHKPSINKKPAPKLQVSHSIQ